MYELGEDLGQRLTLRRILWDGESVARINGIPRTLGSWVVPYRGHLSFALFQRNNSSCAPLFSTQELMNQDLGIPIEFRRPIYNLACQHETGGYYLEYGTMPNQRADFTWMKVTGSMLPVAFTAIEHLNIATVKEWKYTNADNSFDFWK